MKHNVIFVNGPPSSGKDTIGRILHSAIPHYTIIEKAAGPLYKAVREIFGIGVDEWDIMYNSAKEEPTERLLGMSPRQAMIWMSEDVMKPKFGDGFFGVSLANRISGHAQNKDKKISFIITDAGFGAEVASCIASLPSDKYDAYLIRVICDGCTFEGDSREWVCPFNVGIPVEHYEIVNNSGTFVELDAQMSDVMRSMNL